MQTPLPDTIAQFTLDCEARRDRQGRLTVYQLPPGDGGGLFEVAGICERYDHDVAWRLRGLIGQGAYDDAEATARAYYIENTDSVRDWSAVPALQAFLRDTAFHRGTTGCARLTQMALKVAVDGAFGPVSRAALNTAATAGLQDLLTALRAACEQYERQVAPPIGARAKFWPGLVNRWNKRVAFARSLA